ncbi:arsenic resistance protein [Ignatzschineria rhizosphaerae]|uniref:Arsenic resistance protein n=1 Tax=Ignatzschineria rhizosphaerae TaxID=2923279 RepID=A0ABY3WXB5_9GAMM|nr:arsenic resistance protein [Ignatzschineria rhizosphaerae]UNM95248.1 arsenic resistance protein [Ignatzschineria rhizosphaerae]
MLKALEERQTQLYAGIILMAVIIGQNFKDSLTFLPQLIPLSLGFLMFSMFAQIPFLSLKRAFSHPQFFVALFMSNYVVVPLIVWMLLHSFSPDTTLKIGIILVLLTPCIDYVVVFTKLGKGDAALMLSVTPFLFFTQIILLPLYFWFFIGSETLEIINIKSLLSTFLYMIVIPFSLAMLLQLGATKTTSFQHLLKLSAWFPVPLMALVLFLIIATQIPLITANLEQISAIIPLYILFMVIAFMSALLIGKLMSFPREEIRTLIYSTGTRNSLAVLPFAFALSPDIAGIVAAVIVTQTLVELVGELIYTKMTPYI